MAFPQGLFSVLFSYDGRTATFSSRKAADIYWRRLQEVAHQEQISDPARRICPRNIYLKPDYWHRRPHLDKSGVLPSIQNNNNILYHDPTTDLRPDNVNGEKYYIRSAIQPNLFWFYDSSSSKRIIASSMYRTKFTIRRKPPLPFQCRPEDDILIDEDDINIFVTTPEWENENVPDVMIVKGPRKLLVAASVLGLDESSVAEAGTFKFGMFDRGFGVQGERSWDGYPMFASARVNGGERWEFVQ